jgi:polyphosphate kinase 2
VSGNHKKRKAAASAASMSRSDYEGEMRKLQAELCSLQAWVRERGLRVIVVFEGRDAAGKGGVIKRITERVSSRVFRMVALPTPTERERSQLYLQRYITHFPAAGEIVLFDRSWYNRAGVERVMGFCSEQEYDAFLRRAPAFEKYIVSDGIILLKYFLDISRETQEARFKARATDPRRQWKLSPMDIESWKRWWEYTAAYESMISATDTEWAPWYRVRADDKRRARLNCIAHLLSKVPYESLPFEAPPLVERRPRPAGVPEELPFRWEVPQTY